MLRDIINTYRQAFRVYVRQRSRPLSYEEAEERKLFWSKCYMLSGIGALLMATYITYKENINFDYRTDISKQEAMLEKLVQTPSKVIKFDLLNFKKVDEFYYVPPTKDKGNIIAPVEDK